MLHVARQHVRKNRYQNDKVKFRIGKWKAVISGLGPAARIVLLVVDVCYFESKLWELGGYMPPAPTNAAGSNIQPFVRTGREIPGQRHRHSPNATTNIQEPVMRLQAAKLLKVFQVLLSCFEEPPIAGEVQIARRNKFSSPAEDEVDAILCEQIGSKHRATPPKWEVPPGQSRKSVGAPVMACAELSIWVLQLFSGFVHHWF